MRAADQLPEIFNAAEWFVGRHRLQGRGEKPALLGDEGTLTFAQLDDAVRQFAQGLINAGVHAGDRVALILPDSQLLSIGFWGSIAMGAVAVPVNTLLKPADHLTIIDNCGAHVVIADPSLTDLDLLGSAAAGSPIVWNPAQALAIWQACPRLAQYKPTHRDDMAFFLYSSGTTGEPKGVVHLQHDMWASAHTYGQAVLQVKAEDRCLSVAKLFFAYGLGNAQYLPFHVGAAAILYGGRPTPEAVFAQVQAHQPTLFFGVPTAYANLLAQKDVDLRTIFSSVHRCVSAGESLPGPLLQRWQEQTGLEILDGIGSTEIVHIFISNRIGKTRAGSTGVAVPGYDLRIVDDTGADASRGELGELLVRGDSTMAMYWRKHEATKATLRGEWIRTGDRYYQDEDGYYYHGGRSDDMLKVGGIWVSPVEVEGVIIAHPAVLECAVVGEQDTDGLTKVRAYVTLRPEQQDGDWPSEIKMFTKERLAAYKCPRWVTIVAELPKTATGKIQRYILRQQSGS